MTSFCSVSDQEYCYSHLNSSCRITVAQQEEFVMTWLPCFKWLPVYKKSNNPTNHRGTWLHCRQHVSGFIIIYLFSLQKWQDFLYLDKVSFSIFVCKTSSCLMALFTVNLSHLYYNILWLVCEAILGYFVVSAWNYHASTLDNVVMQRSKTSRKKGDIKILDLFCLASSSLHRMVLPSYNQSLTKNPFAFGPVTFPAQLPNGQGPRQAFHPLFKTLSKWEVL